MMRRIFAVVLVVAAGYLSWTIGVAARTESVFVAGPRIAQDPWTWVTIVDLYLGFLLAAGLIVARERRLARWLPWLAAILVLGNLATAAYAIVWLFGAARPGSPGRPA
jgi:hypothetical protein